MQRSATPAFPSSRNTRENINAGHSVPEVLPIHSLPRPLRSPNSTTFPGPLQFTNDGRWCHVGHPSTREDQVRNCQRGIISTICPLHGTGSEHSPVSKDALCSACRIFATTANKECRANEGKKRRGAADQIAVLRRNARRCRWSDPRATRHFTGYACPAASMKLRRGIRSTRWPQ